MITFGPCLYYCMQKFSTLFFVVLLFHFSSFSQVMTVNNTAPNNNNPFWLASNILIDPSFPILPPFDPVTFLPAPLPPTAQVGVFNAAGTGFPIDYGIVMCTNPVQDVLPNSSMPAPNTGPHVDPELTAVLQQINSTSLTINDRAEITFSFFAPSDRVEFNYVFASHEYPTYTCSNFNDVFGFFLTGVGINGDPATSTVNLATIPNTTVPVAINTINQGFPGSSGTAATCLSANPDYTAHSIFYLPTNGVTSMGGYTQKFTASADVVCGNFYSIRLAVANVSDNALSSAVFLEANSFTAPSINLAATPNSTSSFQDTAIVEGCSPTYLVFEKDGNVNIPMTIQIQKSGTAIEGVDYNVLPDSLVLPAGVAADSIEIIAYDDGIVEPFESIIITMLQVSTTCFIYPPQQITLWIRDRDTLFAEAEILFGDTISCPGDEVNITGSATRGEGVIQVFWDDDPSAPLTRIVTPGQTTTYYLKAFDECSSDTIVDSVTVYLQDYTPLEYSTEDVIVCRGDSAIFELTVSQGRPPYQISWQGLPLQAMRYGVLPTRDTTWIRYSILDACGVLLEDSALAVIAPDPRADFSFTNSPQDPLRMDFTDQSRNAVSWVWDFGDGATSTLENPSHTFDAPGAYEVTLVIENALGCTHQIMWEVKVETDLYFYIPTAFTPDGDYLNECFQISGVGFESFEIRIFNRWGNQVYYGDTIEECWDGTINGTPAPPGVYTYTIFLRLPLGKIDQRVGYLTLIR